MFHVYKDGDASRQQPLRANFDDRFRYSLAFGVVGLITVFWSPAFSFPFLFLSEAKRPIWLLSLYSQTARSRKRLLAMLIGVWRVDKTSQPLANTQC